MEYPFSEEIRTFADAVSQPLLLIDPQGVVRMVNQQWEEWSRRCLLPEEMMDRPVKDLARTPAEEEGLALVVEPLSRGETPPVWSWQGVERDSGRTVLAEVSGRPFGQERYGLLLWRETTDRQRLRAALQQALRLESVGWVAGNAAHEINNGLSLVSGYVDLLLSRESDESRRHSLEAILEGGERAGRVAEHLGFFSRRMRTGWSQVDLNEVVNDLLALLRRPFEQNEVMLIEDLHPSLPKAEVHVGQIQLVVLSLIQNGLETIVRSKVGGIVQVRTSTSSGKVIIEVEDDGPGLPPEERQRVFDDFYSAKKDETAGLGLGLCRSIVQEHGGDIRLTSGEEGTCVILELQVKKAR